MSTIDTGLRARGPVGLRIAIAAVVTAAALAIGASAAAVAAANTSDLDGLTSGGGARPAMQFR